VTSQGDVDRYEDWEAHCRPKSLASEAEVNIELGGQKAEVVPGSIVRDGTAGTVKFRINLAKSTGPNDVQVAVTAQGARGKSEFTVVIPVKVGPPRPMDEEIPAQAKRLALDSTTTPAAPSVEPPNKLLADALMAELEVQVLDQFDQTLEKYDGAVVFESTASGGIWEPYSSLNVALDTHGKYTDHLGIFYALDSQPNPTDDEERIQDWLDGNPSQPQQGTTAPAKRLRLKIESFEDIEAGVRQLSVAVSEEPKIRVQWP
jgi:hypothetical protein